MSEETLQYDNQIRQKYGNFIGCDEVGRGCLAGPVIAAAVMLPPDIDIDSVMDSKKLKKSKHEEVARLIYDTAIEVRVGISNVAEIDEVNILEADKLAMKRAIAQFQNKPKLILIDGDDKQFLGTEYLEKTQVKGDAHSLTIGAASIIAKYVRDQLMNQYAEKYPGYGFETNAGYGTPKHKKAIQELGITEIHRKTFEPIKSMPEPYKINKGIEL